MTPRSQPGQIGRSCPIHPSFDERQTGLGLTFRKEHIYRRIRPPTVIRRVSPTWAVLAFQRKGICHSTKGKGNGNPPCHARPPSIPGLRTTSSLPVVGSLSLPYPSSGRRLGNLGCSLIGCLCLGLAPCRSLLRDQHARRLSPLGVLTSRSRTPSP